MISKEDIRIAAERIENEYFKPMARIRSIRIPDARNKLKQVLDVLLSDEDEDQNNVSRLNWLPVYDEVVRWLENNEHKGLLIMGNCGTGKTMLCCKAIPMLLNLEYKQNYRSIPSWALSNELDNLLKDDICIIDDIGMEPVGMKFGEPVHAFATLASNAEQTGQLLILTTNLNYDELLNKYGIRVLDRIKGYTKTLAITGASFR